MQCKKCGTENDVGFKYCQNCGSPLKTPVLAQAGIGASISTAPVSGVPPAQAPAPVKPVPAPPPDSRPEPDVMPEPLVRDEADLGIPWYVRLAPNISGLIPVAIILLVLLIALGMGIIGPILLSAMR